MTDSRDHLPGTRRPGRWRRIGSLGRIGGVLAAAVLLLGAVLAVSTASMEPTSAGLSLAPSAKPTPAAGYAGGYQDPAAPPVDAARSAATAVRVEIPAIAVDSDLEQLALDPSTGALTPPDAWLSAGWYRDGTVPGDIGPAVIAGHVDSVTEPAIFARLGELTAGDEVLVTLSDGAVRTFVVDRATSAPKAGFPTDEVYGPTPTSQLRLITCDGTFDRATGHYLDNLIVFASLES